MRFDAYDYQKCAVEHIIKNPHCALFLEMGLGKTVSALTAADQLMHDYFEVSKVLVIAPLRVADTTWAAEAAKWDHLQHLTISKVLGKESARLDALRRKADIYVINRENVPWLVGLYGRGFPFDMVIIDELSSFKSAQAARFKALRQIRPYISRVVGLTGTPAPNSLIDLWSQMFLLDMGERLGKSLTGYRKTYFTPGQSNGYVVFNYRPKAGVERKIYDKISDICISMKSEDYLTLPKRIDRVVPVALPEKVRKQYEDFEKKTVLSMLDCDISAANAATLTGKLLQFANGAVYDNDHEYHEVHAEKLAALKDIVEAANGAPVLVFYTYKHDLERIKRALNGYTPVKLEGAADMDAWNRGETAVYLAHPASAGHGLNLQQGGSIIVWFGPTWSLELYQQGNARLHRQGQTKTVIVHHLVAQNTMDEDAMSALARKASGQAALMDAVKARIKKYSAQIAVAR